jgi:DNA ligase-1
MLLLFVIFVPLPNLESKHYGPDKKAEIMAQAVVIVKQVFSEIPSYDLLVPALLEHGFANLPKHCQLTPGIPLKPMLAHPTKSLTDVLNRFEGLEFTCEYKYDGERAQIHLLSDGKVMIFSRNSENLSPKYPDIMQRIPNVPLATVKSFVMDCEAVAWDPRQNCILPFQVLSTRKRKDVQSSEIQVQVCLFAFDLLYLNGTVTLFNQAASDRNACQTKAAPAPKLFGNTWTVYVCQVNV